jgi:predicted HTH domain antitoxin
MGYSLTIEYDDEVLLNLGLSQTEFSSEARFILAAKLYEMGRLTSSQAAKLSGLGRVEFLMRLPSIGVKISNMTAEDAEPELAFSRNG